MRRFLLSLAVLFGLAGGALAQTPTPPAAPAPPQTSFTPAQRQAIEQIVREYLLANPQLLVEIWNNLEEQRRQQAAENTARVLAERRAEIYENAGHPVLGNPQGDVAVVEFFDYRCPYCRQVHPVLEQLLAEDRNVRLIQIHLPILGNDSVLASRAALASRRQGDLYRRFNSALLEVQGNLDQQALHRTAAASGVNLQRMLADMNRPEITQLIEANRALAEALGIEGTPAFVVGNRLVPGAVPIETLRQLIADARQQRR